MAYKLGSLPSVRATRSELADFMEIMCLKAKADSGCYSILDASQAMGIVGDDEEDDRIAEELPFYDSLSIIDERDLATSSHYPFQTDGYSIRLKDDCAPVVMSVYLFLLLATRNDMSRNRIFEGVDGGKLFERLCSCVLSKYFGPNSDCFVFGTGDDVHTSFDDKIQNLISRLDERVYAPRRPLGDKGHHQDDKLDVVVHIPFHDKRMGQFVAFGQCKTGDNWRDSIRLLSPKDFSENYFTPPLNFTPIVVNMVSESFSDDWERKARDVVFFDRCRIMRYVPANLDESVLSDINKWNSGVLGTL